MNMLKIYESLKYEYKFYEHYDQIRSMIAFCRHLVVSLKTTD